MSPRLLFTPVYQSILTFNILWVALLLATTSACALAKQEKPLRIAVAANFYPVLKTLKPLFELKSQQKIQLISGASGTLYQQIMHGAPFDVFLSADSVRPRSLVERKHAVANSLTTYAQGQLSLWSSKNHINNISDLTTYKGKLAIANPDIAPYGKAAKQVMVHLGLWDAFNKQLITGININQTFQQVRSGAAELGIVAKSQLVLNNLKGLDIPVSFYHAINQQAVIINHTKQRALAEQFMHFLMSYSVQNQLPSFGYQSAASTHNLKGK